MASMALIGGVQGHAKAADDPIGLRLRPSTQLQESIAASVRPSLPTFMGGDYAYAKPDLEAVVEGNASLRRGDMMIRADRMAYEQATDLAKASGNVYLNRAGNIYEGQALELKVDAFAGFFSRPRYRFLQNQAHGEADRIDFLDDKRALIHNASYTTCKRLPGPDWLPGWILRAASLQVDSDQEVGQADGAVLQFQGVSILPLPSFSFPLSDKRKSGWMPPVIEQDSVSGLVVSAPYYWNIAPQRDATIFPTLLSRRGLNVGAEFRYLKPWAKGVVRGDVMPTDSLRARSRWGMASTHSGSWDTGDLGLGGLGFSLNWNRVSDDNYWRDFPRATTSLTQRLLPLDTTFSWARGDFSASLRSLTWQTLQDVSAPITPPYDRLPQLSVRYARSNVAGFDYSVDTDITQFVADRALTQQVNGRRSVAVLQLSHPWQAPGWFVTPKLQWHATRYQFDTPLADLRMAASRTVPTLSVDSGLVLERGTRYFGREFLQTLEPRALYVNTPFRAQNSLPNYDSAAQDFNFASIYSENAFLGHDRISDSNLLTLGVTSRLLDPSTGAEAVRLGIAQRLRFKDQNVTLPAGQPVKDRISDVMVGGSIHWTQNWAVDSTVQFNPKTSTSERETIGAHYSAGAYRVVSAAYRLQRGLSEQLDVGWQWPVSDLWGDSVAPSANGQGLGPGRWFSVGRMNYSLQDRKLVDAIIGFEYDAGCWLGRVVYERLQSSTVAATQRVMFQLELVGFARLGVGTNPLRALKENIPRYQYLREQTTQPSRFGQYD